LSDHDDDIGSRIRPFGSAPAWFADPIAQSVGFVLVASAVFLLFPGIDRWFSGLFYDPEIGFPMSRLGAFTGLRRLGDFLVWATVIALIAALIAKLVRPARPTPIPPRDILFLLATLAVGPGLLVNAILKENWGRPRPADVDVFGGEDPFVGVWRITDHCLGNCSFVSGEAATAVWLIAVAIVAPPRWRRPVVAALVVVAAALSLNRIAFGRHFLSDVLIAWGLTLLVLAGLHRLMVERPPAWLSNDRLEAGLTWLGSKFKRGEEPGGA
jgi:membrane-associated PAP2 superfamily phosphatase